jgi:hypothetical protein
MRLEGVRGGGRGGGCRPTVVWQCGRGAASAVGGWWGDRRCRRGGRGDGRVQFRGCDCRQQSDPTATRWGRAIEHGLG